MTLSVDLLDGYSTHGSDTLRIAHSTLHECMLLGERWPAPVLTPHVHALRLPCIQAACMRRAERGACGMQAAAEEVPVCVVQHVPVVHVVVVPATREVAQPAARVIVSGRLRTELRPNRGVDELDISKVAEQKGTDIEPLLIRELVDAEDRSALLLGPALDVLAADDVQDDLPRLLRRHEARRVIEEACVGSGQRAMSFARMRCAPKHT